MSRKIKVVLVEPMEPAKVTEIDANLETYQKIVGGYIEATYPFDDEVAIICNEEGKMNGMDLNRGITYKGKLVDIIAGPFIVVGLTEDDFGSLSDELAQKYCSRFMLPEMFAKINGQICAIPMV